YAIYFAPGPGTDLARLASDWLGRDAYNNAPVEQSVPAGFSLSAMAELTADARRYGFHATIVAPFRLAPGANEKDLLQALDEFTAKRAPFEIAHLVLGRLGPYFALVPDTAPQALGQLESDCVEHFQPFRSPLAADDIARRKPDTLTPAQRQNLERWGYPYVREEFRFHMTLTNAVPQDRRDAVQPALEAHFAPVIAKPLLIDRLAVFLEPGPGAPFHCIHTSLLGNH
ncbi:MAG TPA: DUF1045 domain-containing protein, partial [Rhizobiaceae bacterium]|nr:DUF1045 domain-containing protein [Rhizobiaceae bacterium]